jgi:hypothetical protein
MPRPVRNIEIYLPLDYNDGQPIDESKYLRVQTELLARFGGVTSTQRQFPLQGLWQSGSRVFQDRGVVFGIDGLHRHSGDSAAPIPGAAQGEAEEEV